MSTLRQGVNPERRKITAECNQLGITRKQYRKLQKKNQSKLEGYGIHPPVLAA
jgi:hypothetical protein